VTALFADLKGSTELMRDIDPEEARAILDPVLQLMMTSVHRYDGYVAQSTGDGIFAMFGAPVAHEDHPQRALHAALAIQDELRRYAEKTIGAGRPLLEARIGINTGEVVLRTVNTGAHTEYSPVGHAANLAARLQTVAPAGGVIVSDGTRKLVEDYFELRHLGAATLRGIAEPVNVYQVMSAGPLRGHFDVATRHGLTRFVGREHELEQIGGALELAIGGHGQVVAIVAEAGAGKSRLVYEFKALLPSRCKLLEAYSVSYGKASAWLPVLELLRAYFGIETTDDTATRREKVRTTVEALDPGLNDTLPYLWGLLGIQETPDPLAQMDPQIRLRRTRDAIKRIFVSDSLVQPIVVIFEDLHWIDGETQALLDLVADSIGNARVLLLVNYRPEYRHQWANKSYYSELRLEALGRESAAEILAALLGERAELDALKHMMIERTQGNPFFIEEMVQALFDEGALMRNGAVKIMRPLGQLRMPPTVQGILAARIDRLPAEEKGLLQTLAVVGRQAPLAVIMEMVARPQLQRMLDNLQTAEFIYEQAGLAPGVAYEFKHALTQDVAYSSLLMERRKVLHGRVGATIESVYGGQLDDHVGELARHYSSSDNPNKAVEYLGRAGNQAMQRFAFAEAQGHLQQGLERIRALPESPGRDAQELELASALVQVLVFTRGYSAPATVEMAARASALSEKAGDLAQLALHLFGTWSGAFVGGDYLRAAALADSLLELALHEGSPMSLALAHDAQMQIRFFRGDLAGAKEHFIRIESLLDVPVFVHYAGQFVSVMGLASHLAFVMGRPDTARQHLANVLTFTHKGENSFDAAFGLFFQSWLHGDLGDHQRAEAIAAQAVALAEEGGFPYISNLARLLLARERTQLGGANQGVALIREALAGMRQIGSRVGNSHSLMTLAVAQALSGKIGDAMNSIEEALTENPEELPYRPLTFTARGELRLKMEKPDLAEADFREAITLAQKMGAKSYELRASMNLARLLRDTARRDEARAMLDEIYNWFTEGFDTADLKDAKALLDELTP
jgi:class 3 adenylate cyclase/tetratricopeptide (TPR) repeat protein